MSGGRIEFREQKARLRTSSVTDNESREWEAILDQFLKSLAFETTELEGSKAHTLASSFGCSRRPLKFS